MTLDLPGRQALGPRAGPTLLVLAGAPFLAVLDTTIVTIALPSLRSDLDLSVGSVQWVLTGYSLALGSLMLLGGRLGDLIGRRRVFVGGLWLVALAAFVGGLATDLRTLVVARMLMGVGAAAFVPCSLSLLTATYPLERDRTRALAVFGGAVGVAFVTAMLIGGLLTASMGWRAVLFINVPIAAMTALTASRVLDESRDDSASGSLDVIGALLCIAWLGLLIAALSRGPEQGWGSTVVVGLVVSAAAVFTLFVVHQRRATAPLLPREALRDREPAAAFITAGLRSVVGIGQIFVLTLYFQEVRGLGPLATGLMFTPMAAVSVLTAPLAGMATQRWGIRRTIAVGLVTMLVAIPALARLPAHGSMWVVVIGMIVAEIGFMISEVPNTVVGAAGLGRQRSGLAAGLLGTSQQLGHALGLASISTVIAMLDDGEAVSLGGLRWGFAPSFLATVAALVVSLRHLPDRLAEDPQTPMHAIPRQVSADRDRLN
jgi:EmrB/QacA subfamily drug resistance transporter